ncbi:MAG TPA: ATP-binding protein [Azospirillum sp.]|nr:ATP-binding protein [Azospirillum sp.]
MKGQNASRVAGQSAHVRAERIRLLYRHAPAVLAANLINGTLVTVALWGAVEPALLLGWAGVLGVTTLLRAGLWLWFRRSRPDEAEMPRWARDYTVGSAVSALLWGGTAFLFVRSDEPVTLLVMSFVIGGMAAGSVTGLASHMPAFRLYLLGTVLPLAVRLFAEGDRASLAMGGMAVVFAIGIALLGRTHYATLVNGLELSEERRRLLADREREVRERTRDLASANDRLRAEAAERRRAEDEERRLSAEVVRQAGQLNSILSAVTDHVFMICQSGTLLYASPSALRDLGVDASMNGADVAGRRWADLGLPPEEVAVLEALHRRVVGGSESVTGEVWHRTPQGQRLHEYKFTPLAEPDGRISAVIAVSRDVTERVEAETALESARADAERANQAKSRFLAAASHDLRQPMQSMFLFAGALRQHLRDNKPGLDMLVMLERGLDTLKGLLDSLLDVSRLDVNVIQPEIGGVRLRPLMDEVGASYVPIAAAKGLSLRVDGPADVQVRSDARLLGRMIRNLVENAVRYTERGEVRLECRVAGDKAVVAVRDTGIGIPPDQMEKIFEEFHQLHNPERDKARGMGLGLSIVQRLSAILDHPVRVSSEPGMGSCFAFEVPLDAAARPPAVEEGAAAARGAGGLAVLVDDDAIVLLGLRATFEEWGFETVVAGSTEQALERLERVTRVPDLIVADYRLRGGKVGTEAILKIRERLGAAVPGVILTGETGSECARDAAEHGLGVIQKPVTPRHLHAALERLLNRDAVG